MSNSISRQDAIDTLTEYGNGRTIYISVEEAVRRIKQLSPTEPKIVRCKDCREFRRFVNTDITFCDRTEVEVKDNDFCSRAERRADE